MSGLIGDLLSAASALNAHQAGVEIAGRNLANVNNPAYARQRVVLGDRVTVDGRLGPLGNGVEVLGVEQLRDRFLDAAVLGEVSQTALLTAQQSGLQRAESNLGEEVDRSGDSASIDSAGHSFHGISSALNDFFNAFDELAANPTDAGAKQVLLQKANILADKFNVTDQRLGALQADFTAQVASGARSVNLLLTQIADLNGNIAQFEIDKPGAALDLRDERQAKLEELAKFIDFKAPTIPGGNGQIQIVAKDTTGGDVLLVDKTTVRGGISFSGSTISGGAPATPLGLQGGALQGGLLARDGAVQQLRGDLKRTADQVAAAVNGAYSPAGGNFFQVPPASGLLAVDLALNLNTLKTSATADAGANDLALAIADIARKSFSTGSGDVIDGTIGGGFTKTVSAFGESLSSVNSKLGDQALIEQMTTKQRDAVSGVSLDEETTDLMKFQRAYQASSRVIRVLDEMLDTLVNTVR